MQATADATTAALSRIGTGADSPALGNISNNFNTVINNLFNNQRINNITDSFNDLSRTTFNSQYIGAVNNTANAVYNYGRALGQATENVQRHANHTRTLFHRLATTVGQFYILYMAVKKVANIYAEWYTKSNDFIENMNLFEVTMRSGTNAALDYAKSVEQIMGIDLADWLNYQGKFQQLSKGFGVASEQADIMSKNLTQLSYDLSSFFNVDAQKAFEKLSSAMAGQVKGLREYGIDVTVASLQQYALSKGIDLTVRNMTQAQKAVLRYNYILEKTVNIQGDMARTIITPANSLRILNAQLERLKRTLGNIISVVVTKFIPYVQAGVNLITKFAERIANAFGFELPKIDYSGLDDAVSITEDMDDAASNLSDDFADAAAEAKKLKYQLMGFDELNILKSPTDDSTASKVEDNLANLYPSDLGLGIPEYDFGLDSITSKTQEIIDNLKATFDRMYEFSGAKTFFDKVYEAQRGVDFSYIRENVEEVAKDISDIAIEITPDVGVFNNKLAEMLGSVTGFGAMVSGKITEFTTGGIRKWLDKDKEYISSTLKEILGNLGLGFDNLTPIFDDLNYKVNIFFNRMRPFFEGVVANGLSGLTHVLGTLGIYGSKAFAALTDGIKWLYFYSTETIIPDVISAFKNFTRTLYNIGKWIVENFGKLIGQDWNLPDPPSWMAEDVTISSSHGYSGAFASGGFPEMGEYFLARESGPEMVGRIGNQNAVANNDQIVTAVKQGVYEAVMSAQQQGTANTNQPASYDVDYITLGGDILLKSFVRAHNNYVYATGQSPLKMKRGD